MTLSSIAIIKYAKKFQSRVNKTIIMILLRRDRNAHNHNYDANVHITGKKYPVIRCNYLILISDNLQYDL